jgi:hypothetical protein
VPCTWPLITKFAEITPMIFQNYPKCPYGFNIWFRLMVSTLGDGGGSTLPFQLGAGLATPKQPTFFFFFFSKKHVHFRVFTCKKLCEMHVTSKLSKKTESINGMATLKKKKKKKKTFMGVHCQFNTGARINKGGINCNLPIYN